MYCSICREWFVDTIADHGVCYDECEHYVCAACEYEHSGYSCQDCPACAQSRWCLEDDYSDEWDEGNGG